MMHILGVCTFCFIGCAQLPMEKPELIVKNYSNKTYSIQLKRCGEKNSAYKTVANMVKPKEVRRFLIEDKCIDARAVTNESVVQASQKKMIIPPKVQWKIY